jgi:hypothetical protein
MATIYPPRRSLMSYLRVGDDTPGTSEKGPWSVRPAQHAVGHAPTDFWAIIRAGFRAAATC